MLRHSNKPVRSEAGRYDWLLVGIIVAVALFLRLYQLASAPPGLSGDELFNAIDAQLIGSGNWPIFFEGNYGREAFFFYLMAASMKLLGSTIVAVRLPAVLLGTGSVILAFLLGRNLFNRRVGLLTAGLVAVSLWPVMESRWGLRAVSLTFLTALTIYFFHKAVYGSFDRRNGRFLYWLFAGISLGLTFYTYIPSRVFPAVLIGWFGWLVWRQRELARQHWRQFLLALLIAFLIFAPFGYYMMQYPDKVNQRINTMSSAFTDMKNGEVTAVIEPIIGVLLMFSFVGDNKWRYHLSGQPVFDPLTSIFFYIGIGLCLWFAFARQRDSAKWAPAATYALVLLWLGAMLAPNAVTDANSSFLRAAGALIPVYLLTGIGVDGLYQLLIKKWPRLTHNPVLPALVILGLGATLLFTWHGYFNIWRNNADVREIYTAQTASMAVFLAEQPPPADTRVYVADRYAYGAAPRTMGFYTDQPLSWFMPSHTFPWDETAVANWYLVPADEPLKLRDYLPAAVADSATMVSFADGQDAFVWYRVPGMAVTEPAEAAVTEPAEAAVTEPVEAAVTEPVEAAVTEPVEAAVFPAPSHPLNQAYQDGPTLLGYDLPDTLYRGEALPILLHWQIPAGMTPQVNQQTFTQVFIEDGRSHLWGMESNFLGYPQAGWQAGDKFVQQLVLELPAGLPPEPMTLRIELAVNNGAETYALLGEPDNRSAPFVALARPLANFSPDATMPVWDDTLVLKEATLSTLTEPGLPIDLSLDWVALQAPDQDYRVTLTLLDPHSKTAVAQQTEALLPAVYPTSQWQAGEQLRTQHRLQIPIDIPPEMPSLELHVSVLGADKNTAILTQGDDKVADITLVLRDHLFEPPPISQPLEAQFGSDIRLLGYDLNTQAPDHIGLTLYWQALNTPSASYTVFTHLRNEQGEIVAQLDSPPVSEAWLTSAWLPGEIVVDERQIPWPEGTQLGDYSLAIGLYDENGRLSITHNNQPQANDQLIIPGW